MEQLTDIKSVRTEPISESISEVSLHEPSIVYEKKVKNINGKVITIVTGKEREEPKWKEDIKEFKWLEHLMLLKEKGYRLKFVYTNKGKREVLNNMKYFEMDSEKQSFVPIKPESVQVFEYKDGDGFEMVAELDCEDQLLDPPLPIADMLWNIATSL